MNYEQKYNEALERARDMMSYKEVRREDMEYIFPELKGSEDERIRKQIISFLKEFEYDHYRSLDFSSWMAWLEKQGQSKKTSIWKHWKDGIAGNGNDIPVFLIKNGLTYSLSSCLSFECDYIELSELDRLMLEKQGEPKDYNSIDSHLGKHINKVEPKFNLYDWVVTDKGDTVQIGAVNNGYYTLFNGMDFNMSYVDKCWHKWTIKEAKDGDVLAGKIDGDSYILIYKQIKDGWIETYGHYYDSVDRFCVPSQLFCREVKGTFHPATKEQRDLLFQKMKEAGYEWNEDKKELIKL